MRTPQRLLAVAATVSAMLSLAGIANAATTTSSPSSSKILLAVSPTRAEIPATQHSATIKLYSGSSALQHITSSVEALGQTGKGLVLQSAPPQYGAAWLKISPASFTLKPGQQLAVHVTIAIPAHQVGQRNLAVVFRAAAPKVTTHKGAGAVVSAGVASTLIIDVPGKAVVHPSYALSAPGFSTGGAINVKATVNNTKSNFYDLANGIQITDPPKPVARFNGLFVLAGATQTETATWSSPPMFGIPARLALDVNGKQVASASVIILPLPQIGGALAVLIGLVLLVIFMRKRRARLISRAVEERLAAK